jgi:ubiquinone biosynthesis protein UbiJ
MPKAQPNKKPVTIDRLAELMQREFMDLRGDITRIRGDITDIRSTMATKDDLRKLREEMATKQELEDLRGDLGIRISSAEDCLSDQIAGLRYAKEIDELRERVNRVERKLGISDRHRAA